MEFSGTSGPNPNRSAQLSASFSKVCSCRTILDLRPDRMVFWLRVGEGSVLPICGLSFISSCEHATTRLEAPQKHRWTAECGKTTDASGASSAVIDWGGAFQMVDSRGPALELSRPFWYSRSRLAQDAAVLAASKRQLAVECRVRPRLVDSMTISADLPKVNVSFAIQTGSGLQRAKPYTTSDSFALLACSGWMTGSNARQPTSLCCLAFPMRSCG